MLVLLVLLMFYKLLKSDVTEFYFLKHSLKHKGNFLKPLDHTKKTLTKKERKHLKQKMQDKIKQIDSASLKTCPIVFIIYSSKIEL